MWKKTIIFGLILLFTGAAILGWALVEQRREKQLLQEQLERLDTKLAKLDKLIAGEIDIPSFAKIISTEDWQQKLNRHRTKKKTRDLAVNVGIVSMLTGAVVFTWWLLLWTARLVIYNWLVLKKIFVDVFKPHREIEDKQPAETDTKKDSKASNQKKKAKRQRSQLKKQSKALKISGWHSFNKNNSDQQAQLQTEPLTDDKLSPEHSTEDAEKIAVLYTDEESVEAGETLKLETDKPGSNTEQLDQLTQDIRKTAVSETHEDSLKHDNSHKQKSDNLEKQAAESGQKTGKRHKTVEQTAIESPEPINDSLKELTQQVAAIREYASQQQERVNKLQEGYDWNITRTFCLKVIRCIDNLENRIGRLSKQNINTPNLEEIKDELVFALESSGVEQFQLEIKSDYRGQEKSAEAVKERECSNDTNLKGKIAKVIRSGYRYVIDEKNIKVVRPARVKLFG